MFRSLVWSIPHPCSHITAPVVKLLIDFYVISSFFFFFFFFWMSYIFVILFQISITAAIFVVLSYIQDRSQGGRAGLYIWFRVEVLHYITDRYIWVGQLVEYRLSLFVLYVFEVWPAFQLNYFDWEFAIPATSLKTLTHQYVFLVYQ